MGWQPRLLCCLFLCLSLAAVARAATVHQEWEISYQFKSPDCVRKLAVTINGQTPGPTIRATQRDTVVVTVKNSLLTENVAIHWHGIRQIGTPWADGTEGVTQCPILPGDTFNYTFVVDRPGTYMYHAVHAHYGMQRSAGLNGMIVVNAARGGPDAEPFTYDGEHDVLLNDWWHKSTYEQATGLASVPLGWVGEPQSLLINGRGRWFSCSRMAAGACNATHPECAAPVFAVVPGKTYRFRIASVTSLSALNFEIEGHNMTVVEADGHYVKPFVVKNLNIYSGETYSVLIKANQDPNRNYWLASNVVSREPGTPTGTAVLSYYGGRRSSPRKPPPTTPPTGPAWNDTTYRFRQSVATVAHPAHVQPPPPRADRTIILLLNTQNKIDGRIKWALNNVSFTLPHTPYLVAMKNGLLGAFDQRPPPETFAHQGYDVYAPPPNPAATTSDGLYRLKFGSVVDVVLQNANMLAANKSETHPWHLHGHDFWVLGYRIGRFDPAVHPASYNLKDPILKNTVAVHPYGWTALRFKADNPGVWAFHCHIESHFFMGMGIVFEEGVELAVTINGQTPGPTIRATQGDTLVVLVKNSLLTENVAIHWHGIRQIGTPWADGTEGVTQCPILPGDTFTYTFVVDRPGTYMYHAHYGMQRSAGLNGLIVVAAAPGGPDAEPFRYDGEHHVLLNDWWHKSTYEQATGLASVPLGWVGEPQSLLINGRGRFVNCSAAAAAGMTCNATLPECAAPVFAVVPGKTFPNASITSLSALNFEIEGHEMTVVEADGHYVKPFVVKNLNIYSGETYSVTITANQDPNRNYWVACNVISREPGTPTGTAILSYYSGRSSPRKPPPTTPLTGPASNDTTYRLRQSVATVAHPAHVQPPPPRADRTILLLNTQNKIDGRIKWALNNVSFTLPHTPYLVAMKHGLLGAFDQRPPPETYAHQGYDIYAVQRNPNATVSDGLYRLQFGSVVDVVLQNANMLAANKRETHPWHLHGHDFWVLGYGIGCFDPEMHPASYNLKDPIMKNTVAVHPYGWTALRFMGTHPECATPVIAVVLGRTYRPFRIASVTSLSALNFEMELQDHNARLFTYVKKPITVEAVASGSTSSRRPPMGYQQYGAAALVAVMLCLFVGEFFVALYLASGSGNPQNPAVHETESTIVARSRPADGSASGSLPVGGGHAPPPSTASASSSTSTTDRSASATSSTSGEERVLTEEDPGGPHQRPVLPPAVPLADNVVVPLLTVVLALLAFDVAAAVGILTEFERIVGTWSTAPQVVYGVLTVVAVASLAVGLMATGRHARAGNNSSNLSVSSFCAKLGAILFTALLVVAFSCKLGGRWARVAAVPTAAVVACIMAAVWIWGDEHAVASAVVSTCWGGRILGQRRQREPPAAAGDDMV